MREGVGRSSGRSYSVIYSLFERVTARRFAIEAAVKEEYWFIVSL